MRTPAGTECRYFYGDYRRGRNHEECRLLEASVPRQQWTPDLCRNCPVPAIQRANACPNIVLNGRVHKGILGIGRRVEISAYCTLSEGPVSEPEIGCGKCHPIPIAFTEENEK
jgi:hypothetical protein